MLLLRLLALSVGLLLAESQRVCPRGWLYVNDKCWKYETNPETWLHARDTCERMGSDLASIHAEEENRFLHSLIQKYGVGLPGGRGVKMILNEALQVQDLTCFEISPDAALVGFAEAALNTATADECLLECLNSEQIYGFGCKSAMYYADTEECILNTESKISQPDLFTKETFGEKVDYYDNFCGVPTPPTPTPSDDCFDKYPNMIIVGFVDGVVEDVSVEECQDECLKSEELFGRTCNSIMYYTADRACILNEVTKDTQPDLFTSDLEADYYQKKDVCPDGGGGSCDQLVDMVFVVDGSGSIGPIDFENVRLFLNSLIEELSIGPEKSQVAFVQFTQTPVTEFHLKSYQTKAQLKSAIDRVGWRNGRTLIGRGLQHVIDNELLLPQGDRPSVQNVVLVLTDGLSQDNPLPAASTLRNRGTVTYAIGVTDAVFDEQLMKIAGSADRVYKVRDFTKLDSRLKDAIMAQICTDPNDRRTDGNNGNSRGREDGGSAMTVDGVWIGLMDNRETNNFNWIDGTGLDYENWRFGQPDDTRGEQCVVSEFEPLQRWSDKSCNEMKPFVCKQEPTGRLSDASVLFRNPLRRHNQRLLRYRRVFRHMRRF